MVVEIQPKSLFQALDMLPPVVSVYIYDRLRLVLKLLLVDPGLTVNIYYPIPTSYTVPGPRPWRG